MLSNKNKLTIVALLTGGLLLSACDKVKEVVDAVPESKPSASAPAKTELSADQLNKVISNLASTTYGVTEYQVLEPSLSVPAVYDNGNYKDVINNYNLASTIYKNTLYRSANLASSNKSSSLLNELYSSLNDLKDTPKSEIIIFYIDSLRNLQRYIQQGLNSLNITSGINKGLNIGSYNEKDKVQFLSNLNDGLDQITDNFFALHQFLGKEDFGLDAQANIVEYERYQNIVRELKNQNAALVQYDTTCTYTYKFAGDVINCLQSKFSMEFAALDAQLLNTLALYFENDKTTDKVFIEQNLRQLKLNLANFVDKNYQSYKYYQELLANAQVK